MYSKAAFELIMKPKQVESSPHTKINDITYLYWFKGEWFAQKH